MKNLRNGSGIDRRSFIAGAGLAAGVTTLATAAGGQSPTNVDELARLMRATQKTSVTQFRGILDAAAREEGIRLTLDQMVVASKYNYLFVGAPARGVERIAPLELKNGIIQGMIGIHSPASTDLQGFYVVRAVAVQGVRLGEQPVLLQMLRRGVVLAEEPGMARVWSLTLPPRAGAVQAELGVGLDLVANDTLVRANCWTCPNGVTICVEKPICGPDGLLPSGSCG